MNRKTLALGRLKSGVLNRVEAQYAGVHALPESFHDLLKRYRAATGIQPPPSEKSIAETTICAAYAWSCYSDAAPESSKTDDPETDFRSFGWTSRHLSVDAIRRFLPCSAGGDVDPFRSDLTRPVVLNLGDPELFDSPVEIWDGVHRLVSAANRGVTLPAIVGVRMLPGEDPEAAFARKAPWWFPQLSKSAVVVQAISAVEREARLADEQSNAG